MYFKDLTKYKYAGKTDDSLNIGWLSRGHKFSTGEVPEEFVNKLWKYLRYPVQVCRGFHVCELCKEPYNGPLIVKNKGILRKTGFYEMRVWGKDGKIYAAPSLIYHYITCHKYKPPQEFIDAVMESEDPDSEEYYQKVLEYSDGYDFWLEKDRMMVMKWAEYRRQEHNRKKCEKEQREKEEQKQKEKAALRENWKLYLVGALLQILAVGFVVFFTMKTGHPGLALIAWWIAIWTLFGYCKRHKPKIFKWLPVIPIFEFLIFVVLTVYTLVTDKWAIGHIDIGLISLCAFFSSIINGVMYLGTKFKGYKYEKREKRK